jgi:uncharacterized membrane protein YgaE (UPF0421/DUF939 family)
VTPVFALRARVAPDRVLGRFRDNWVDRFAGSDPGLNRFRMALQTVLTIGIAIAVEGLFIHYTQALYVQTHGVVLPAKAAAKVAAADHTFLAIAMILGAATGLVSSLAIMDKTIPGQLVSLLIIPVPLIGGLAFGLAIAGYRVPALISFPVVLAVGTYLRRFGPRGLICGILIFIGELMGFFLKLALGLGALGWLAAEIGLGLGVAIVVRYAFFYPRQAKALQRTQRSWAARARKVAALALELLESPRHTARDGRHVDREAARLHHQLIRLNEAALMIDAQLAGPRAVAGGPSAQLLHQRLFDAELALANIARFAQAMAGLRLPAAWHMEARLALRGLVRGDNTAARAHAARLAALLREAGPVTGGEDRTSVVITHRFAGSVTDLTDAITEWEAVGATSEGEAAFQPRVQLLGGWLPGSVMVSGAASLERGTRPGSRIRLPLYLRTAIQIGIAAGAAVALGDALSATRFYWAPIAVLVVFSGANNNGEQLRKACFRVAGTLVGIVAGSLLVTAVGHHTYWSIAVILAAFFFGLYLLRISYVFMVFGVTVMVSQLYVQLGEFTNSLLVTRLEETALGAAVGIAVANVIFPLRTRRVAHVALRRFVQAVGRLAGHASDHLRDADKDLKATLRSDARAVDAAYQALMTTAQPLRPLGGDIRGAMRLASAARNYSRNLVADAGRVGLADAGLRLDIELANEVLQHSMDVITGALAGSRDATYTRSAAVFDRAERRIEERVGTVRPAQLAIRDLKLIDGTMARLAEAIGLAITNYDTVPAGADGSGGARIRGHVCAPDGTGVGFAALTLIDPRGRQAARTVADADGAFWLDEPAAGPYTLLVSAASRAPAASTVFVPEPALGNETVVNVRLAETGSLRGQDGHQG